MNVDYVSDSEILTTTEMNRRKTRLIYLIHSFVLGTPSLQPLSSVTVLACGHTLSLC